jgi:heme-degrading monooxygenase HmoA
MTTPELPLPPAPDDGPTSASSARTGPARLALPSPCYAVIFTSLRKGQDGDAYGQMAEQMVALAGEQPGYLGMHSARGPDGLGITVSYWRSNADILAWKQVSEHRAAQQAGRERWYAGYELQVTRVERAYAFGAALPGSPLQPVADAPAPTHPV